MREIEEADGYLRQEQLNLVTGQQKLSKAFEKSYESFKQLADDNRNKTNDK